MDGAAAERPGRDVLDSRSLVELATERLRAEILSGALAPGQRVVEESIGRRFGISRAPLREALRLLAQQGMVEHLPRRGVRVATWSPRDIRQLFELRAVLERHAVRTALPLKARPDPDPLHDVRANLTAMRAAEIRGDDLAKDDAHRAFHAAVVALADNRQLELALAPVLLKLQLPMAVNLRREAEVANPGEGLRRHEALLAALESDDVDTVLAAMASHGQLVYLPLPPDGDSESASGGDGEGGAGAGVSGSSATDGDPAGAREGARDSDGDAGNGAGDSGRDRDPPSVDTAFTRPT